MVQVHGLRPADAQKEHQQRLTEETIIIIIITTTTMTIMMMTIIIIIIIIIIIMLTTTTTHVFAFLHFGRKFGSRCCLATRRLNHLLQKAKNVDKGSQTEMLSCTRSGEARK